MLRIRSLRYTFQENGVHAVDGVDLDIAAGEIHALIGENGAGKSTLARIIAGHVRPHEGSMSLDDSLYAPSGPEQALDAGVALVPQHPVLVPDLTVWQNLLLGKSCKGLPRGPGGFLHRRKVQRILTDQLAEWGIPLPLDQKAITLNAAQIHWAAIAEALLADPKVLILDEPSAPYGPDEIALLFGILAELRNKGLTVVIITHRLSEVQDYCDNAYVLRHGTVVLKSALPEVSLQTLERAMFDTVPAQTPVAEPVATDFRLHEKNRSGGVVPGNDVVTSAADRSQDTQRNSLVIKGLRIDDGPGRRVTDLDCTVSPGTIAGILGFKDQGIEAIEDLLAGIIKSHHGSVSFCGSKLEKNGTLGYIPSQRFKRGIAEGLSIFDNALVRARREIFPLGVYSRSAMAKWRTTRRFGIDRPDSHSITTLSGGMIQRLIIDRELSAPSPRLIVCAQPYWGLDRYFQSELKKALRSHAIQGACILVLSSDVDEIIELCDSVSVLVEGRIVAEFKGPDLNRTAITRKMMHSPHKGKTT